MDRTILSRTHHTRPLPLPRATRHGGRGRLGRSLLLAALFVALLLTQAGCKHMSEVSQLPPSEPVPSLSPGEILDLDGHALTPPQAADIVARGAYVLLGEAHPYACDHQAQAEVIELMAKAGTPPVVGLEMVSLDRQFVLDRFNSGKIGVEALETELDWEHTWGYPFEIYKPIFEVAAKYGLPLFALNAPRDIARKVGENGLKSLSYKQRLGLPSKIIPPSRDQEDFLREIFDAHPSHEGADREKAWQSFLTVQGLWDTTMARRAVEARVTTRRPVAIVAGAGHVERGWGIALRLAKYDPQGRRVLVMPYRGTGKPDSAEGDLFYFCPEQKRPRLGVLLKIDASRLTVIEVVKGSRAETAGIAPGDVIERAQGVELHELKDLHDASMKALGEGGVLHLDVRREGKLMEMTIQLSAPAQGS